MRSNTCDRTAILNHPVLSPDADKSVAAKFAEVHANTSAASKANTHITNNYVTYHTNAVRKQAVYLINTEELNIHMKQHNSCKIKTHPATLSYSFSAYSYYCYCYYYYLIRSEDSRWKKTPVKVR